MNESKKEAKATESSHSNLSELSVKHDQRTSEELVSGPLKRESHDFPAQEHSDKQQSILAEHTKIENGDSIPTFNCPLCKEQRSSLIQCLHCGDRRSDTEALTPYQRLLLPPRPLYDDTTVQAAKEKLLIMFHPLKASRLNAHWSLKQRALICRDANTLQRISGALITYTKYMKLIKLHFASNIQNIHDIDHNQALPINSSSNIWSLTQNKVFGQRRFNSQLFLLKSAFLELQEYDSYQEREKLFNQGMRFILSKARSIANQLYRYNFQEPQLDLDELILDLHALQEQESWLEGQRLHQPLKVKHDIAL